MARPPRIEYEALVAMLCEEAYGYRGRVVAEALGYRSTSSVAACLKRVLGISIPDEGLPLTGTLGACGIGWMTDVVGYTGVPNPVTPSAVKRLETVIVNGLV